MEELIENLKVQLIEQLNLEEVTPAEIGKDDALFGDGLGLDSIDALELIVLLDNHYDLQIPKPEDGKAIFQSVQTLADFITANKKG
jgi:acyl carrier protein